MSLTDDDQFAAYGGANYDYLAMGPSGYGFVTMSAGNDPNFRVGASVGGNTYGVFAYAGPGADDGNTVGPAANSCTKNAAVLGTSLQFTGVAGTTDSLQPGVYGQCGDASWFPGGISAGVIGVSRFGHGVFGRSQGNNGVSGQSDTDTGVWGASSRSYGVLGQTGGFPFGPRFTDPSIPFSSDLRMIPAGVLGTATDFIGVAGASFRSSGVLGQCGPAPKFDLAPISVAGVMGTSRDAAGVGGISQNSTGVSGSSSSSFGMVGISGTQGPKPPTRLAVNLAGVYGNSRDNFGVIGTSQRGTGVVGYSPESVGVYGQTDNPASYAGVFIGSLFVTGQIFAGVKDAIVPFPDGTRRLLHCMESPEHWFEDFGDARLKDGKASIKLDVDFAKVVTPKDYRVFLTPEGDCEGLYVSSKKAKGFEVRELRGGTSSVRFSYRIVGRRKDIKGHKRFAKIDPRL